jgi:SAM-dependent methyltransferase
MIGFARNADPAGDYRLIAPGDFSELPPASFDLALSAFAFDNIPGFDNRAELLRGLRRLLTDAGRIILFGARPEAYVNEWASFTTKDFPENQRAKSGETVRVVMKDVPDARPVLDVLWSHEDYLDLFAAAELDLLAEYRPLGRVDEPYEWVSETTIAPWMIYVLRPAHRHDPAS